MRIEYSHGRLILCAHILKASDVKVGQTWMDSTGRCVTIKGFTNLGEVVYADDQRHYTKDVFPFQTRYCLVLEPSQLKTVEYSVDQPEWTRYYRSIEVPTFFDADECTNAVDTAEMTSQYKDRGSRTLDLVSSISSVTNYDFKNPVPVLPDSDPGCAAPQEA